MKKILITEIDFEEFRGIKRCKKPIKLKKFNVLIGKNNSGKSALLEALFLFPSPLISCVSGYKSSLVEKLHGGHDSLIYGYSGNARIMYKANNTSCTIKIKSSGDPEVFFENKTIDSLESIGKLIQISEPNLKDISIYIPTDTNIINSYADYINSMENEIVKSGKNKTVAEFVNQCIDEKYTEVFWKKEGLYCRKERPDGTPLYIKLNDMGDGIKRATIFMLLLEAQSPHIVLWDDFENASHPTLIKAQLEWLAKKDWQVVLSTHSIDVLYQLLDIDPTGVQVIQLKKLTDDMLIHTSLSIDNLNDLMNANSDPRQLVDALGV